MVEVIGRFTKIEVSINEYFKMTVYGISNYEAKYRVVTSDRKTGWLFDVVDTVISTHESLIYAREVQKSLVPDLIESVLRGDCIIRLYNYSTGKIDDERILTVAKPVTAMLWLLLIPIVGIIYYLYKKK
jgi:hypothetical protein